MKKIRQIVLGVLSTAFLAVGFSRAADRMDPMTSKEPEAAKRTAMPSPDTSMNCHLAEEQQ
jgi:hypothetical protein